MYRRAFFFFNVHDMLHSLLFYRRISVRVEGGRCCCGRRGEAEQEEGKMMREC